jgi:hypothetical protein
MSEWEEKGGGSASGGKWIPKKEADERFVGTPGEIKECWVTTKRETYLIKTKIGNEGYAIIERHYSCHPPTNTHTNPHDHLLDWSKNEPDFSKPINYYNEIPELENYGDIDMSKNVIFVSGHDNFKSLSDFKQSLIHGREIEFEWNGIDYLLFYDGDNEKDFSLCEADKDNIIHLNTIEDVLNCEIQGVPLRRIITDVIVWCRNL